MGTVNGSILLLYLSYDQKINEMVEKDKELKVIVELNSPIYGLIFESYVIERNVAVEENVPYKKIESCDILMMICIDEGIIQASFPFPLSNIIDVKFNSIKPHPLFKGKCSIPCDFKVHYRIKDSSYYPHSWIVLADELVYYGLFRDKDETSKDIKINDFKNVPHKKRKVDLAESNAEYPVSVGITQFHLFFLYKDTLSIMSIISKQIKCILNYTKSESMLDIQYSTNTNAFFISSNRTFSQLIISSEEKGLWKLYLESGNFVEALLCSDKVDNSKYFPYVAGFYAESLFEAKKFQQAADNFFLSNKNFEEVVLKYIESNQNQGLESYLDKNLHRIQNLTKKKAQRMLLCSWILELKLSKSFIKNISDEDKEEKFKKVKLAELTTNSFYNDLQIFLRENAEDLDLETTLQQLQCHGKIELCILFAQIKKSYETVIVHYLNNQEYKKSLEEFNLIPDHKLKSALFLKYGSIFMMKEPLEAINLLIQRIVIIEIDELLPSLMCISPPNRFKACEFIKERINNSKNKLLHNLYVFFLLDLTKNISLESDPIKKDILKHFEADLSEILVSIDENLNKYNEMPLIDLEFALNTCKFFGNKFAQIIIYGILGFYEEAINEALGQKNIDLATMFASKPKDLKEKKKLWLKIAKYVMESSDQVEERMKEGIRIMKVSEVLSIDDILHFVSQNVQLSTFKNEISSSLETYGKKIEELKFQMKDYNGYYLDLQKNIQSAKSGWVKVTGNMLCELCKKPLLISKKSSLFNCGHNFHTFCLSLMIDEISPAIIEEAFTLKIHIINASIKKCCEIFEDAGHHDIAKDSLLMKELILGMREEYFNSISSSFSGAKLNDLKRISETYEEIINENCALCYCLIEMIDVPFMNIDEIQWAF